MTDINTDLSIAAAGQDEKIPHEAHSAEFAKDGGINLIYKHPDLGDIPYHATAHDSEILGRELFELALSGEFGKVKPFYESDDEIAERKRLEINAAAHAYLVETGWYVERFAETGKPIPEDIKSKRQAAREAIK